jgi:hypothetical protein
MRKTINDVKKLLRDNPEYGAAFHDYFETRREELMSVPWVANDDALSRKCSLMAGFIQDELLNEFGLKDVSRNAGKG